MACDLSRVTLLRAAYANTMVDLGETKSMSLSLRLLREGLTVEQALRDDHELEEQPAEPGRLFLSRHPHHVAHVDPFAFEALMSECLRDRFGQYAEVIKVGGRKDRGIDILVLRKNAEKILVQVKRRIEFIWRR